MSSPTSIVRIEDVSKRFVLHKDKSLKERVLNVGRSRRHVDDFWALRDINAEIHAGTTVGLIGANGSGKSTLLKVIGAIIQPTTGSVLRRGRLAALLELGAGFHQDLTGRENVYLNAALLGMSRAETDRHFDAIVDFSGIEEFIDTQVKFYSSGMYVRLAFSVAVHVDPDLLLVDEVLAVGDEPFQRKCMDKIRSFQREGRTIALVSHSADQVGELCDRTLFLRDGRVVVDGPPEEGIRALRQSFESDRREREDAEEADSPTHPRARITQVRLNDAAGTPTSVLRAGEPLRIGVDVDLLERVPGWRLGVSIETPLGQYVYGTSSERQELGLPTGPGVATVEISVPQVRLGSGQYVIRTRAWSPDGETLDLVPQGALFSVELDSALSTGVVDMTASMRVTG
ncbi:sugar ABC transporter [Actinotalea ferrariae CF5-4]|uniref:Sugar ABC transporter n=1 Tax=Actinotalea ferrariae CF5-4 TaxID=948458 RepID=A0A021W0B2_9CELL|nr:ABC transporter ATP-binding protein [Actinotalea ferrariae]EYR64777.1 sugar ABC transporter [Actinotalea ferrariae CF5-4]